MKAFVFSLIMTIFVLIDNSIVQGQGTSISQKNPTSILAMTNTLEQLAELLPGTYKNTQQYQSQPTAFYHVTLNIDRIWADRDDAIWFYVRQAQVELQDHPYQEQVYKIYRGERDTLIIKIYTLASSQTAIGSQKDASFWKEQQPKDLLLRQGCAIQLTRRKSGYFVGKTQATTCPCVCSLENAVAMQSQISISLDALKIWDKGFDATGQKVWGPDQGAYYFERYQE